MAHRWEGRTRTLIEMGGHFIMIRLVRADLSDGFVADALEAGSDRLIPRLFVYAYCVPPPPPVKVVNPLTVTPGLPHRVLLSDSLRPACPPSPR